jgi:hypothetical protein
MSNFELKYKTLRESSMKIIFIMSPMATIEIVHKKF